MRDCGWAELHFRQLHNHWPPVAGSGIYSTALHRASSQRGDEDGTIADSIAALDEARAVEIARDMLHFLELVAGIADEDAPWR